MYICFFSFCSQHGYLRAKLWTVQTTQQEEQLAYGFVKVDNHVALSSWYGVSSQNLAEAML